MKKTLFSILAAFALHFAASAQSVAINTSGNAADNSAILDVSSTSKGMLVPRLSTTQRTGISTPATGLLVYDTDLNSFYFYNGTVWTAIAADNLGNHTATQDIKLNGQKLNNNGTGGIKIDDNGKVGIGTLSPLETVHFVGTSTGGAYTDQNTTTLSGVTNGYNLPTDAWQSFTVGTTGFLTSATLFFELSISDTRTLSIYEGEGTAGTLLGQSTITPNGTTVTFNFSNIPLTAGTKYSMHISSVILWTLFDNGGYAGGTNNFISAGDFKFYTSMFNNTVNSNNYVFTGIGLGIGTTSPTEKLEVSGKTKTTNFQLTNGATNGYVLKSDALGNGTWTNSSGIGTLRYVGSSYLGQTSGAGSTGTSEGTSSNRNLIAMGNNALDANTTGENNIGLGYQALYNNTTGSWNTAIGKEALKINTTGNLNTAIGNFALTKNTTGSNNVAIGQNSLDDNTIGEFNIAVGNGSLNSNTEGLHNVAIGYETLGKVTTGNFNTTLGNYAGFATNTGNNNTSLGYLSGATNVVGSGNVYLGYRAGYFETGSNKLYISNSNTNSPLIHGDFSTKTLTINENLATKYFKMTNGATNGYVLKSDALGNGTWTSATETDPKVSSTNANYIPRWTGSTLIDGTLHDNNNQVGVGTFDIAPESKLAIGSVSNTEGGEIQLNRGATQTTAYFIDNYADKLRIKSGTNSGSVSQLIVIESDGKMGIGTTSPDEKLEVSGKTKTTNFQMTNGATNGYVLKSDASGNASWAAPSSTTNWTTSGNNQYNALSGNVGIGTTTPATKLHVIGDATFIGTVNMNSGWNMQTGSDFFLEKSGTRYLTVYGNGGNVGIGTTSPNSTLQLNGSMAVKTTAITTNNNNTTLGDTDYMVIYNGTISNNQVNLPTASSTNAGRIYIIVNHSSNAVTSSTYTTANGTTSTSIAAGTTVQLVSTGSNWHKIN